MCISNCRPLLPSSSQHKQCVGAAPHLVQTSLPSLEDDLGKKLLRMGQNPVNIEITEMYECT